MRNSRLPPRCKWVLRSFGILRSVDWYFLTDVTGQPVGPNSKGQVVKEECYEHKGAQFRWDWCGRRLVLKERR